MLNEGFEKLEKDEKSFWELAINSIKVRKMMLRFFMILLFNNL
jgi:hypothetical protein